MQAQIGTKRIFSITFNILLISALGLSAAQMSMASNVDVGIDSINKDQPADSDSFGKIPADAAEIDMVIENAQVNIQRVAGLDEITLSSNCPGNWAVRQNVVRQVGFGIARKGVAMQSDALGSRVIVNGKVYLLPSGPIKGLQINSNGVFISGQKIEPCAGSPGASNCLGKDTLEVKVPDKYTGGLKLGCTGQSEITVDAWKGGEFVCTLLADSKLTAHKLNNLDKAVLDNQGRGNVDVDSLHARIFVANSSGSGSITVKDGSAEMSNATVEGSGQIVLKGDYKNLKQAMTGTGSILVTSSGSIKIQK